ncbi:MAG: DUF2285 domain-containing protein [Alphaproteobacteria bacterium]|nr:DUF2285 domain-containing protein [Alphaproteobacteria bacterium]MDE2112908.1 DUF2285 domain-containing protein [Alphaproteobacteria bacterium]MDE2493777.1 DUF2285 domain-containing protein [Alphaproteobacteria bacterium]
MPRRPRPTLDPYIADVAPTVEALTDYDYTLLVVYIRMLDAEAAKADWREVVRVLFKIDPEKEPARALRMYDSHMMRAHWMTQQGYRHLLMEDDGD